MDDKPPYFGKSELTAFARGITRGLAIVLLATLSSCAPDPSMQSFTGLYAREIQGEPFDTVPVRGPLKPLRHRRAGYEYKCSECHTLIAAAQRQQAQAPQHADIVLSHGMNTNCLNCHHPSERNSYLGYDGEAIPADQPARLCAKCHGPQFRDWERGVHGRQNGHWDASRGPKTKLFCIQCHDPHDPKFQAMQPVPPPAYNRFMTRVPETRHE